MGVGNKLRVYTLTLHFPRNFGAVLQAYALLTYLTNVGCDAKIIDYWPPYANDRFRWYSVFLRHPSPANLLRIATRLKATITIDRFKKRYYRLTKRCNSVKEIEELPPADLMIVGSDQVWNHDLLGEYYDAYFLNFKTDAVKASYAASAGLDRLSGEELDTFARLAKNFDYLSVREEPFRDALESHDVSDVKVHLDPVFLLDQEHYRRMARSRVAKPYVLVYYSDSRGMTEKLALRIAKAKGGIPVYRIGKQKGRKEILGLRYLSVEEFLGMIDRAECIVSRSFHACAFAILLRKQFYAINDGNASSRLRSLLGRFELTDRFVEDEMSMSMLKLYDIDYSAREESIIKHIDDAKSYINAVVDKAQQRSA